MKKMLPAFVFVTASMATSATAQAAYAVLRVHCFEKGNQIGHIDFETNMPNSNCDAARDASTSRANLRDACAASNTSWVQGRREWMQTTSC